MAEMIYKSEIDVDYVDHMGDDERIVQAAMVSTKGMRMTKTDTAKRKGLINSLIELRHGTPFECGALTVRVHAPIKVWREWMRHRIGWSYNEESGRYKQLDPVFWIPPITRPMIRLEGFKPMRPVFDVATPKEYEQIVDDLKTGYTKAYAIYEHMLSMQVDRGLARDVLGVGIFSACYCTANPRSIMHFLELRTQEPTSRRPSKPLWEIDSAARKLEAIFAEIWPVTHTAWLKNGRSAP